MAVPDTVRAIHSYLKDTLKEYRLEFRESTSKQLPCKTNIEVKRISENTWNYHYIVIYYKDDYISLGTTFINPQTKRRTVDYDDPKLLDKIKEFVDAHKR